MEFKRITPKHLRDTPIDTSYADQATMIADQANQIAHYIYFDGDVHWEYLALSNGTIADYRQVGGIGSALTTSEIIEEPFNYISGPQVFNLTLAPPTVWVFLNGVYIPRSNYILDGLTVTITSDIPENSKVIIKYVINSIGNAILPPVSGTYASQAAMIAAQGTQVPQYIYFDGSYYWEYRGTTNGNITDYRRFSLPEVPHNSLEALDGGEPGEYYHLNLEDYNQLRSLVNLNPAGTNWVSRTTPSAISTDWYRIAYGNGIYIIGSISGDDEERMMISYNGIDWAINPSPPGVFGTLTVAFGNGIFVIIASGIYASTDGVNWTQATGVPAGTWRTPFYANGYFFASNTSITTSGLIKSTDGLNWTAVTIPVTGTWSSVAYGAGVYVIVALSGPTMSNRVLYSTDTITWNIAQTTNYLQAWTTLVYANGLFVAVSSTGSFKYSADGINWTAVAKATGASSSTDWGSLAYGRGTFVATGGGTGNDVQVSTDGITWTSHASASENSWLGVVYSPEHDLFVASSRNNDGINVMTNGQDKVIDHSNINLNDGRNPHQTRFEDLLGDIPTSQDTTDYIDDSIAAVNVDITALDDRVTDIETQFNSDLEDLNNSINTRTLGISISGGGNPLTTGIKGYLAIPYNCEIISWYIVSDTVGSIEIDVWNSSTPPTGANTITASNRPKLIASQENSDTVLTGWTTTLNQGDVMAFNVVSASTVTFVNLVIKIQITL